MAHQPKIDLRAPGADEAVPPLHNAPAAHRAKRAQPVLSEPAHDGSQFHDFFRHFAHKTSAGVGSPWAFVLALTTILVWAVTGPLFHFSDTWQLVINTGTTIVTFLMVFLIQNTQNRDAVAIHLKLDELIRALKGARNRLVDLEELSDEELDQLHREFQRLGAGQVPAQPYTREERR